MSNQPKLTADEIEVRIWAFVVFTATLILFFIVVALILRTTYIIQPIKQISPMDQADQKMLNDIVLLIVGGIGGIMGRKGVKEVSELIAKTSPLFTSPSPTKPSFTPQSSSPHFGNPNDRPAL